MLVLHRVGNRLVAEQVYKIEFDQGPDGATGIQVETEGVETLDKSTIIIFLTEEQAVERFNAAVDPQVALNMMLDLMPQGDADEEGLKAQALDLEKHLDEVIEGLRKAFRQE